jgi:hypothetical protein
MCEDDSLLIAPKNFFDPGNRGLDLALAGSMANTGESLKCRVTKE